jgi:hypothetical protein
MPVANSQCCLKIVILSEVRILGEPGKGARTRGHPIDLGAFR